MSFFRKSGRKGISSLRTGKRGKRRGKMQRASRGGGRRQRRRKGGKRKGKGEREEGAVTFLSQISMGIDMERKLASKKFLVAAVASKF